MGVAEQLAAAHGERHHAQRAVAHAALETSLVDNLALHLKLLHRVDRLAADITHVPPSSLFVILHAISAEDKMFVYV